MYLSIPYHRQDTDYTCGPAALQMLLHHFNGIYPSEIELTKRLNTKNKPGQDGTQHVDIDHNATLESLESLLKLKLPALVHYIEPEGDAGHYAVVVGMSAERIYLNDPWHGSGFSFTREEFETRWHDGRGIHTRWLLVASSEPILTDLHLSPEEI